METTKGLISRKGPHLLDILGIVLITGISNCMNKCACVWSAQTSEKAFTNFTMRRMYFNKTLESLLTVNDC